MPPLVRPFSVGYYNLSRGRMAYDLVKRILFFDESCFFHQKPIQSLDVLNDPDDKIYYLPLKYEDPSVDRTLFDRCQKILFKNLFVSSHTLSNLVKVQSLPIAIEFVTSKDTDNGFYCLVPPAFEYAKDKFASIGEVDFVLHPKKTSFYPWIRVVKQCPQQWLTTFFSSQSQIMKKKNFSQGKVVVPVPKPFSDYFFTSSSSSEFADFFTRAPFYIFTSSYLTGLRTDEKGANEA